MPLYEYTCEQCGRQSEQLVSNGTQPSCPECGGSRLSKLLSIVAVPNRGTSEGGPKPGGSCGAGCGCHPHG
jgi:putative FmdB family regulatory protein